MVMKLPIIFDGKEFESLLKNNKDNEVLLIIKDNHIKGTQDDGGKVALVPVLKLLELNEIVNDNYPKMKESLKETLSGLVYQFTIEELNTLRDWYISLYSDKYEEDQALFKKIFGE